MARPFLFSLSPLAQARFSVLFCKWEPEPVRKVTTVIDSSLSGLQPTVFGDPHECATQGVEGTPEGQGSRRTLIKGGTGITPGPFLRHPTSGSGVRSIVQPNLGSLSD